MFGNIRYRTAHPTATILTFAAATLLGGNAWAVQFDNDSGDNTWETPENWAGDALPGQFEAAEIFDSSTVNLSSTQSILELQIGDDAGVATLNILPGGSLTLEDSNNRVGREAATLGSAQGRVIVSGGSYFSKDDTNMSADKALSADSLISVSGGTFINGDLASESGVVYVGDGGKNFLKAEFRVVGSGATRIATSDLQFNKGANADSESVGSFVIDAGGVTAVEVIDQLQFNTGTLQVSLSEDYDPANGDIRLFDAARLTGDEAFANAAQGSTVSASTSSFDYSWTIDYIDNNDTIGGVYLRDLQRSVIPEPASLALLGVGGLLLAGRRRGRGC